MSSRQALAARHLARKVTHTVSRNAGLPSDLLTASSIDTRYCGGTGFPEGDSVAYEPTQGLLAVGTSDGRVVLMGRPGVEATLRSASRAPTQHLAFLVHKGGLLRVTQDGDIQLFSAVSRRLLTSTWLQGDAINAVAPLPAGVGPGGGAVAGTAGSDAYVLLGCESGSVRVVAVLDGSGAPAAGASSAADLALQPYQVLAQEVDGKGGVVAVSVALLRGDRPLLLLVHRRSGAVVWDIRAERVLCLASEEEGEGESSLPTCACWVGDRADTFALGYADGSILVFGVPPEALHPDPFKVVEPPDATLLLALRVAGRGVQAGPVRSLSFLPGGAGAGAGSSSSFGTSAGGDPGSKAEDCLLVFGGQGKEDPDMLTLLPLAAQQPGEGGGRQVPWFGAIKGFCTMPADGGAAGSGGRARGLMILTEGGQLVVHDLQRWQPTPLTLPIQEMPPITVARLVPTVSAALLRDGTIVAGGAPAVHSPVIPGSAQPSPSPRGGEPLGSASSVAAAQQGPQHGLTLERVRACSRRAGADVPPSADHWPFTGGVPAASLAGMGAKRHPSALYFSGHRDGRVRVWDATTQVPEQLLTIPASAGQERLRAVTALEVCPFSGLVIVGHQGGDVRLYQFSDSQQTVHRINVDETLMPYENVAAQPAGFQYVLRYSTHAADITAVSLATKLKLAAVADEGGTLSLLDLLQPAQLFSTRVMAQPVAHAVFGSHVIPGVKEEPDVERVVLFLAGADSSLCMVGLDSGEPIGHGMRPKNASRPLALALLDATGIPLPLLHGQLVLAWANNNAVGGAVGSSAAAQQAPGEGSSASGAAARVNRLSLSERAPSSQSPLPPAGVASGRRSTGADSHRSWSRADSDPDTEREGSVEVHELPSDDDLDSHLAAAVQAADEEKRQRSKFKLPKAFQGLKPRQADAASGAGAPPADAGLPHSPTSSDASAARPGGETAAAGGPFDPVGALQEFYGGAGSPPLSPGLPSPRGLAGAAGAGELLSEADLLDYPYLVDGDPSPATYLLLACADYLRVYTADNVRLGDRSTLRKASFETPLCFAAPFMSTYGPGVASVDASDALQVHSLPGLEVLCRKQLEDSRVLGFRWACAAAPPVGGAPAGPPVAAGAACCSMDGQLVLASVGNELARLALIEDCALPAAPPAVYDMKLAAATAAAAGRRGGSALGGYPPRLEPPAAGVQLEGSEAGAAFSPLAAAAAAGKGFGRFLDQAATTVTGLATSAADSVKQELQRLGAAEGGPSRSLPSLQALFATPVEADGDDIDYMAEYEDLASSPIAPAAVSPAAAAGSTAPSSAAPGDSAGGPASGARKLVSPREAAAKLGPAAAKLKGLLPGARARSERSELLERDATAAAASGSQSARGAGAGTGGSSGWAAAGRAGPANRDPDAIKRAYGRPGGSTAKAAGDVRSIMEQNRDMLAERGERLRNLDEKSAQVSNDAGDFASMAKQLADQYANKKWYQL
ncbi:R-Tomsyn-like family [Micractinium conductrix]|uniref:R-Tomsyn-like family n=1 Tax=Micractinium conductrix TaxID=554055 RepID=A0A2P6VRM0_9CHLO|nr:R-Tomsyn-like family [Micractinium conductrix]|eukprot:PSC76739.1 R-Tomsyn-like family [Micractinium conductrix]